VVTRGAGASRPGRAELDALRPDYTGAHGADRALSPWLSSVADAGTVFDQCWSTSSWTAPACASLFSGLYPPEHGIVEGFMAHGRRTDRQKEKGTDEKDERGVLINTFDPEMVLLPQYLAEYGYRCFGLSANPNVGPELGFGRGFERLVSMPEATADRIGEHVAPWRDELADGDAPYFLYLHYMDVHKPYNQRAPWYRSAADGETRDKFDDAAEAYRSELGFMDQHLAALEKHWGWDEDTLLIVVSDHGEEFGEHGGIGHRFQLHAELSRVLCMVRGAGVQAGRIQSAVGLHDVLPTLLEWLEMEPPIEGSGQSLAASLTGEELADGRARKLYAHRRKNKLRPDDLWSLTEGRWRMILGPEPQDLVLFDLQEDPFEQSPIPPAAQKEVHARLAMELRTWAAEGISDRAVMRRYEQTDEERAALERLGYTDSPSDGG
jgi:arylsulfatase A-like enzyme